MSYLDKKYISPVGSDFTEWVNTEEDFKKFEEMCDHERKTVGVPVAKCIGHIVAALNLGRELKGIKAKVKYIVLPSDPSQNG